MTEADAQAQVIVLYLLGATFGRRHFIEPVPSGELCLSSRGGHLPDSTARECEEEGREEVEEEPEEEELAEKKAQRLWPTGLCQEAFKSWEVPHL